MMHFFWKYVGFLEDKIKEIKFAFVILAVFILSVIYLGCYYENFNLIRQTLYTVLFFVMFLVPGYAILSLGWFKKLKEVEKFVLSFGISFFVYAVLALGTCFFYGETVHYLNLLFLVILNIGGIYFVFKKKHVQKMEMRDRICVAWLFTSLLLFVMFLQIVVALPFAMPDNLQDGPFVFKNKNNLHIKIQSLTGDLPADNYVPFVFSQFLLREISFEKNRPMLPGQEVSNRTVLMGLNATYFLSVFKMSEVSFNGKIGIFSYVGTNWPDVGKFGNDNEAFSIFLTMAMIMNVVVLFSVWLLISEIFSEKKGFGIMFMLMLFPYIINQTIFTWPKFLMAYFLINSVYLVIKNRNPYLIGLFLALAFHSHPSAMVYIAFIILYWLIIKDEVFNRKTVIEFLKLIGILIISILPWIIWTKFIIEIPSDLISQNAVTNDYRLLAMIKVRLDNLYLLFSLGQMQSPSLSTKLFQEMTFTVAGAIGVYFLLAYFYIFKYIKKYYKEVLVLFLGPIIFLTMPWGKIFGNFSILFAQPVIPLYFAFAVILFLKNKRISFVMLFLQVVISCYAFWFGMYNINLQIIKTNIPEMLFGLAVILQIIFAILGIYILIGGRDANE